MTELVRWVKSRIADQRDEYKGKIICFAQSPAVLDVAEVALSKSDIPCLRINGKVSRKARAMIQREFATSPEQVLLMTTQCGGSGGNWISACNVCQIEPDFNPHNELQALARVNCIGQTKRVTYKRLVARNSIDERILEVQRKKLAKAKYFVTDLRLSKKSEDKAIWKKYSRMTKKIEFQDAVSRHSNPIIESEADVFFLAS
jgi:SNF2 family DNA or RNA helicase